MVWEDVIYLLKVLIFPGLIFLVTLAFLSEWIDRKLVAKLQSRVGPLYTGPLGILQPLADFIKLLSKEDITPVATDKILFSTIPIMNLSLSLTTLFFIPISSYSALVWFEGDLILIMFIIILKSITMFLGAWASTNRLSTVGGVRVALQMLSYEIPLTIALICPAISAKSLSISKIVQSQANGSWYLFTQPIGFAVVILCLLAELHMVPFDIPEAETEIVAGWFVEYSGKKLALLRLARDVKLVLAASLMTSLYLGGNIGPMGLHPTVYFLIKIVPCILVFSNLRALFARFKIDQVLRGAWRYLTPFALLQVILIELSPLVIP